MKKYQIMINNIRFKIIAGKINKIPEFYTTFARKMPDYIIRHEIEARPRPRPIVGGRGQSFEAEIEAKFLRSRLRPRPKFWPRGQSGLEDLTSLSTTLSVSAQKTCLRHARQSLVLFFVRDLATLIVNRRVCLSSVCPQCFQNASSYSAVRVGVR